MVGPQCGKNLSENEPDWPIGGATATKSTKLLITPRPFDLESNFLHHCDPWLKAVKMYISKIDLGQKNVLLCPILSKTYFRELVPGFLPDQNQTSLGQFSGLSRSIIIEKKFKFALWFTVTGSFRKGGVSKYTQKPINHA